MNIPFYTNPDVLEKPWGTKHDAIVFALFIASLVAANFAYLGLTASSASVPLLVGIGGAYVGLLCGVILHLGRQIKKGDEFAQKIISGAIAHAGLTTILFVAVTTVINGVRGMPDLAMWNIIAPVFFLFIAYLTARQLARQYSK